MANIRDLLKKQEITSELMTNREKGNLRDLYGEKLHLTAVDFLSNADATPYVVMVFSEYPAAFYFGGSVLTNRLTEVADMFEDLGQFNAALSKDPVEVVFSMRANKRGTKTYTVMEVI